MLPNNTTQAAYHGDGPIYDGESVHQAAGRNTAYSLGGHLLSRAIQGVSSGPQPGHAFEDEPLDSAERSSQDPVQNAYRSANGDLQGGAQDGTPSPAYTFNHAEVAGQVRAALRPGV